jgi:hypothetical protein
MKVTTVLAEASVSPKMQQQFDSFLEKLKSHIKAATNINISDQWLAGLFNQFNNFQYLEKMQKNYATNGNEAAANDLTARIIARDALAKVGLVDANNRYLPKNKPVLSAMRQYYSDPARAHASKDDVVKQSREANDSEYQDWFDDLPESEKNFVTYLHELSAEDMASIRGLIQAKEQKQGFFDRLQNLISDNPSVTRELENMGIIYDGKLAADRIESLRQFLSSQTPARLKDILSKDAVYAAKKSAHDEARSANKVVRDIEQNTSTDYKRMVRLYHFITRRLEGQADKERGFRRMLQKIPLAHDNDGNPSKIGKGAYKLFKAFGGKKLDFDDAIRELNNATNYPASRERRAKKATGRGKSIKKSSEI